MISESRFYALFLAALRARGTTTVDTRDDRHHAQFASAVEVLRKARETGDPGATAMPRTISASMFTGRFKRLDDALLRAQYGGRVAAPNPFYVTAELKMSEDRARQTLTQLSEQERDLVQRMAEAFVAAGGFNEVESAEVAQ